MTPLRNLTRIVGCIAIAIAALAADKPTLAIVAGHTVDASGALTPKGVVVIAGEKIAQVGGDAPSDVQTHTYGSDAVVCPGLVECYAALGSAGDLGEINALEPAARARDAFDRFHSHMGRALRAGVTTFALAPDENNLVGGRIAICQTSGPDRRPRMLVENGPIMLSLSPGVFRPSREPTSRAGAVGMLREALAAAKKSGADSPLAPAISGKTPVFFATPAAADVATAVELLTAYKIAPVVVHTQDAHAVASDLHDSVAGAIVGPLTITASPRTAQAAGRFERAGVKVAITAHLPFAAEQDLRIGAAVAARNGLPAAAARRAITATPAEFLGVSDRIGVLKKDAQADAVVFSGDPLDLRSRVLAVYVAGQRVYVDPTIQGDSR